MSISLRTIIAMSCLAATALSEAAGTRQVIYVPEVTLFPAGEMGLAGDLAQWQYDLRMSEQTRALSRKLDYADVIGDVLRAIACPTAAEPAACQPIPVVPEQMLDEYLMSHTDADVLVLRVSGAGIFKEIYQINVLATLAPAGSGAVRPIRVVSSYTDWDATGDSVREHYRDSLRQVADMIELALPYTAADRRLPEDWAAQPRLRDVRKKGEPTCVKNPIGDRILRQDEARVWIGGVNEFGLSVLSAKRILCK